MLLSPSLPRGAPASAEAPLQISRAVPGHSPHRGDAVPLHEGGVNLFGGVLVQANDDGAGVLSEEEPVPL